MNAYATAATMAKAAGREAPTSIVPAWGPASTPAGRLRRSALSRPSATAVEINPIHSILLISTAVALGRDDALRRRRPAGVEAGPHAGTIDVGASRPAAFAIVAAVAYAFIVGGFGRYSWPVTVAVVIPGALVLVVA